MGGRKGKGGSPFVEAGSVCGGGFVCGMGAGGSV